MANRMANRGPWVILHNPEWKGKYCSDFLMCLIPLWHYCCPPPAHQLSLPFPSLSTKLISLSLGPTLYPPYLPLLCVAKRCPPTYHDEHHRRLFCKCRLADAGARRRWYSGPFDDRSLRASIYVFGYITFALYFSRIGCHYHLIQHPTSKQQGEKFYHTICASSPTACTRSFMSLKSSTTSVTSSHHGYLRECLDGFPHFFIQRNLSSSTRLALMPQPSFASSG